MALHEVVPPSLRPHMFEPETRGARVAITPQCDLARGICYRDPNICDPRSRSHTHEDTATLLGALIREPGQNLDHLRLTMRRIGGYQQVTALPLT